MNASLTKKRKKKRVIAFKERRETKAEKIRMTAEEQKGRSTYENEPVELWWWVENP